MWQVHSLSRRPGSRYHPSRNGPQPLTSRINSGQGAPLRAAHSNSIPRPAFVSTQEPHPSQLALVLHQSPSSTPRSSSPCHRRPSASSEIASCAPSTRLSIDCQKSAEIRGFAAYSEMTCRLPSKCSTTAAQHQSRLRPCRTTAGSHRQQERGLGRCPKPMSQLHSMLPFDGTSMRLPATDRNKSPR